MAGHHAPHLPPAPALRRRRAMLRATSSSGPTPPTPVVSPWPGRPVPAHMHPLVGREGNESHITCILRSGGCRLLPCIARTGGAGQFACIPTSAAPLNFLPSRRARKADLLQPQLCLPLLLHLSAVQCVRPRDPRAPPSAIHCAGSASAAGFVAPRRIQTYHHGPAIDRRLLFCLTSKIELSITEREELAARMALESTMRYCGFPVVYMHCPSSSSPMNSGICPQWMGMCCW